MRPLADSAVVGLFAKRPVPGAVKTRLAAATSPAWAGRVAEAFLRDTLARLRRLDVRRVVVFAPADAGADMALLAGPGFELVPQSDGDLGADGGFHRAAAQPWG